MALVKRARAAGILATTLLMLSSLGATGALAGAAPPQTPAAQTAAVVIGTGSCVGNNACFNAVGPIGDNSCIGEGACASTKGAIGDNSCIGLLQCQNAGTVGDNSCASGYQTCLAATSVGDNSCNGSHDGCWGLPGIIGSNSCNGTNNFVCYQATVGDYSCNSNTEFKCTYSTLGDCVNNDATPAVCDPKPDAQIRLGSGSFVGDNIYNTDAGGQKVFNTGAVGQNLTFFIKIQNDSTALTDSFKVKRSSGFTNGYRVRYYNAAGTDVTGQVTNGSFTTPSLAPGGDYVMRATVKIKSWATACSFTSRLLTVSSSSVPSHSDAVRFTAARATPDLNCPPVAVDDEASITENSTSIFGNILGNDTDPDGDTLVISSAPGICLYCSALSIFENGNYVYALQNSGAVDLLNDGEMLTEDLIFQISDGNGGTDTSTLTITIHGVTDPD